MKIFLEEINKNIRSMELLERMVINKNGLTVFPKVKSIKNDYQNISKDFISFLKARFN